MSATREQETSRALRIVDDAWQIAQRSFFVKQRCGRALDEVPDIGLPASRRRSAQGSQILTDIATLDVDALPAGLRAPVEVARLHASAWACEEKWYWHVIDPLGVGVYGMFAPTAYCGGLLVGQLYRAFAAYQFNETGDLDRYLGLVADLARLLCQMRSRTAGQAERGIVMPRAALDISIEPLRKLRAAARDSLLIPVRNLDGPSRAEFVGRLERRIDTLVLPEFDALIDLLESEAYASRAPTSVGMTQYPGGAAIYSDLARLHTTLQWTPTEIHQEGIRRMTVIREKLSELLAELGFAGSPRDFLRTLENDGRWTVRHAGDLPQVFHGYLERIRPHMDRLFGGWPSVPCDVAPLPDALCEGMTFGMYSPSNTMQTAGLYLFNGRNLVAGSLASLATLTYHELVPGHHLHLTRQATSQALHPLQRYTAINAFSEGWAEYAATLAGELGLYAEPEERVGRLIMDAFLTARLVVDTGLNAFNWSLDQAQRYLADCGLASDRQCLSECIRYSCDIPGQALGYKLGDGFILELRELASKALGERFDLRVFHEAVLSPGTLPLPALREHVTRLLQQDARP